MDMKENWEFKAVLKERNLLAISYLQFSTEESATLRQPLKTHIRNMDLLRDVQVMVLGAVMLKKFTK